jgi:hypothetical protein
MDRREYWLNQVKLQEASGESQAKYCARNGISDSSFSTWRSRLRKESLVIGKFVLVGAKEPLEVRVGKALIRVPNGSDLSELRRIVEALSC